MPTGGLPVQGRMAAGNSSWSKKHLQSFFESNNFFPAWTSRRGKEHGVANVGGRGGGMQASETLLPSHTSRTFVEPFLATSKTVPPALTELRSSTVAVLSCRTTRRTYSILPGPFMVANLSRPGTGDGKSSLSLLTIFYAPKTKSVTDSPNQLQATSHNHPQPV